MVVLIHSTYMQLCFISKINKKELQKTRTHSLKFSGNEPFGRSKFEQQSAAVAAFVGVWVLGDLHAELIVRDENSRPKKQINELEFGAERDLK